MQNAFDPVSSIIHKHWPLQLNWIFPGPHWLWSGMLCVWDSLLSFWNKIGPGHLVRRVPTVKGKNIPPPLKGQSRRALAFCMVCCGKGSSGSHDFCFIVSADGELFILLTFSLWKGGEQGKYLGWDEKYGGWGRVARESRLGIIRQVSVDFYIFCLGVNTVKSKGKSSFSLSTFSTHTRSPLCATLSTVALLHSVLLLLPCLEEEGDFFERHLIHLMQEEANRAMRSGGFLGKKAWNTGTKEWVTGPEAIMRDHLAQGFPIFFFRDICKFLHRLIITCFVPLGRRGAEGVFLLIYLSLTMNVCVEIEVGLLFWLSHVK